MSVSQSAIRVDDLSAQLAANKAEPAQPALPPFEDVLSLHGVGPLTRGRLRTLQINVGKLCNQACHHCHVDAGPKRTETMGAETARRLTALLEASPSVERVDITGGAPELNPNFRYLVTEARRQGRAVMVRCNLTVLFVTGMDWLIPFYRDNGVELVCSLPCYLEENVDAQRGRGVFGRSIEALNLLNRAGYGEQGLTLDLVYNPVGAFLPPAQAALEARYKSELAQRFGVRFRRLYTLTNMPIARFARQLRQWGRYREYMGLLVNHFNPRTVDGVMCRSLVSAGWDGRLYDCDFNQMLDLPLGATTREAFTVWDVATLEGLEGASIATRRHCFGCTAGSGSSCGGVLA
jgi:radical SAM/Cys-rich protein